MTPATSVATAMAGLVQLGNYHEDPENAVIIAAHTPGEPDAVLRVRMPKLQVLY